MNDAHACDEARGWYGRSQQKVERPDLLLGAPVPAGDSRRGVVIFLEMELRKSGR